jgi:hypothetical protein
MPRKLITKLRIRAKSGQTFFRASTFAACHPVSRGRGLLNNAAAAKEARLTLFARLAD